MGGCMRSPVWMIVLLGILLLSLVAPFAALAPLMVVIFILGLSWIGWALVRALVSGEPEP